MQPDDPVILFTNHLKAALTAHGMFPGLADQLGMRLHDAGFRSITCHKLKIPMGAWARNRTLRLVGLYMKTCLVGLMPGFRDRLFPCLGLGSERVDEVLAAAKTALDDAGVHRYFTLYNWCAQKPL